MNVWPWRKPDWIAELLAPPAKCQMRIAPGTHCGEKAPHRFGDLHLCCEHYAAFMECLVKTAREVLTVQLDRETAQLRHENDMIRRLMSKEIPLAMGAMGEGLEKFIEN
jgi:hypothetical protein